MYQVRSKDYSKRDLRKRWALPDRVFFACGACHILAYAFLERYGRPDMRALWFKPAAGYTGNHIVVTTERWVFDYHGFSNRESYFAHVFKRARQKWPGWSATLVELPREALVSEQKSRDYDGLWLREPTQFPENALPRARAFLNRFPAPQD
ncbi:hypothetical protein [Algihabitans albus]|uniref:hypothetical protein n=1 Tax=Algihabitans albus TaxID=2164067 RepID=UPI000E5D1190|nr:hypothetical protein [Algihabitans albus]